MRENDATAAVHAVREASVFPSQWPKALEAIAIACQADFTMIQVVGDENTDVFTTPATKTIAEDYVSEGWHLDNPRMKRGLQLTREGHPGLVTEWHSFTPEELARQPFQQDFVVPRGIDYEAAAIVASGAGSQIVMNIVRNHKSGAFHGSELADMDRLVSLLSDTFALALRLKFASAQSLMDALDSRTQGAALLSVSGRLLHASEGFRNHVHGLITLGRSRLQASNPTEDQLLQAEIARAAASPAFERSRPVALRRKGRLPLVVRCSPIAGPASDFLRLASVLVTLDDPSVEGSSDGAILAGNFGLTPAETRLAALVGAGVALGEAASRENVSIETARKRLKTIFAKTSTHRQSELAVLVSRLKR